MNGVILSIGLGALLWVASVPAVADDYPSAEPTMTVETEDGDSEETSYSGSAPITVHFKSNPTDVGEYTPAYEWRVYKSGEEDDAYLIRYDEDFDYTFTESGTSYISLAISFVLGTDTIEYEMEEDFTITVSESVLNIPNAFSPNGDGQNDVFKAKEDYASIIEFKGYIFNRAGKKIFEWDDVSQGWDGKSGGKDAPVGVYYCRIDAKGADGQKYKIRKAIHLFRDYHEESTSTSE